MNWRIHILIMTVGAVFFSSCEKNNEKPPLDARTLELTTEEKEVVNLGNKFAFNMFEQLSSEVTVNENLFFSPLSVGAALAMTSNGAKGETLQQIKKALNIEGVSDEVINTYYKKLISDLPHLHPKTTISIANSIWYRDTFSVLESFLNINRDYFRADVSPLDFAGSQAVEHINGWVNEKTKTKIPTILDNIPDDAVMYLINAIYFKGAWDQKFDKSLTQQGDFKKLNEQKVKVDFMQLEHTFNILETGNYQAVQLPYTDHKFDMVVIKPVGGKTLADLKNTFEDVHAIKGLVDGFQPRSAIVHLPKFKTSYESSLNTMLQVLGMSVPFDSRADFTGITANGGIMIDEVKHKAFVEVNEEGTEAAAVTVVGVVLTSVPVKPVIKFDEPFLFLIREVSSGLILFAGQINDPTVEETKK